jgi:hypothetical protein
LRAEATHSGFEAITEVGFGLFHLMFGLDFVFEILG